MCVLGWVWVGWCVLHGPTDPRRLQQEKLWLVEYKSRVGAKDVTRMARDSLQLGVYALAVRRLLGRRPSRLVIESIEDGRIGTEKMDDDDDGGDGRGLGKRDDLVRACVCAAMTHGAVCVCGVSLNRGSTLGGGGGAAGARGHRRGERLKGLGGHQLLSCPVIQTPLTSVANEGPPLIAWSRRRAPSRPAISARRRPATTAGEH